MAATRSTGTPPQRRRISPRARVILPALLLAIALLVQYRLSTAPVAAEVPGRLSVPASTDLVFFDAAGGGPLLAYAGPPNESADIRFERARLAPQSIALLRAVGLDVTDQPGAIGWISTAKSASRTVVEARAAHPPAALPQLRLRALGGVGAKQPEFEVEAHGGSLEVVIATPFVPGDPAAQSQKILNVAGRNYELPGAIPLTILVADGASWRARFAHATDVRAVDITLGRIAVRAGEPAGLIARAIGSVPSARPDARYEYFACAAPSGALSWRGTGALAGGRCTTGGAALTASRLVVHGASLELEHSGSAWAQRGGASLGGDFLARVYANPVLAGVVLALNVALLAWLLLEVFGSRWRRLRAPWTGGVFLSYRRDDSAAQAGRLHDHLSAHFGMQRVFIDVDTLVPGDDFDARIRETLAAADALLAVIGPRWLEARDERGVRRIDDPRDFVRLEIAAALERGTRVIPVLVGNATMPPREELPPPLAALAHRNAIAISDARFAADVQRLIVALEQGAPAAPPEEAPGAPAQRRDDALAR